MATSKKTIDTAEATNDVAETTDESSEISIETSTETTADGTQQDTVDVTIEAKADESSENGKDTTMAEANKTTVSVTSDKPIDAVVVKSDAAKPKFSASETSGEYTDYVVMPDSAWPPPIFVKRNVTPQERFYLQNRWHSQWHYYDKKATENKNSYFFYQRIVVIGSLVVPALIGLNSPIARALATLFTSGDAASAATAEAFWGIGVDAIIAMISLSVAGAAALESLNKFGDNWTSYRAAAEELQSEKNYYDMKAGPYSNNASPFTTFVERVENIVAKQNGSYFQALQATIQKQEENNESIVQAYLGDDDEVGDDIPTAI